MLRLLAVHAHPDDESSKGAATYAHYAASGARVCVVSCTGGERGSILNDRLEDRFRAERDLAGLRRVEMRRAQALLGIEHRWLGYQDSGLPVDGDAVPAHSFADIPVEVSLRPLVRAVRDFRPHVIISYDENGGYPHPDHIRAHEVAVRAFDAAADPGYFPDAGAAWQTSKLYYDRIFTADRARAVRAALAAAEPAHPLLTRIDAILEWLGQRPSTATTHVPVAAYFDTRDAALRAHASQVPPDSDFFFWPNDIQATAWPTEDFELVRALVPASTPESDLFAGVTDDGPGASDPASTIESRTKEPE